MVFQISWVEHHSETSLVAADWAVVRLIVALPPPPSTHFFGFVPATTSGPAHQAHGSESEPGVLGEIGKNPSSTRRDEGAYLAAAEGTSGGFLPEPLLSSPSLHGMAAWPRAR